MPQKSRETHASSPRRYPLRSLRWCDHRLLEEAELEALCLTAEEELHGQDET